MKSLALAAATITLTAAALTGIAAPAEAAGYGGGYGGGHGYRQYYGYPGSICRFVLPYGSFGYGRSYDYGGSYGQGGHGYQQYHAAPVLSARRVIRLLRRCDYRHIRRLTLYGGVYRAQARDRHGRRVNLVVDAYTGAVLAARYAY